MVTKQALVGIGQRHQVAAVAYQGDGALGDLLCALGRLRANRRRRPGLPGPPDASDRAPIFLGGKNLRPRFPECAGVSAARSPPPPPRRGWPPPDRTALSSVSAPASRARTAASAPLNPLAMPPISSASVTTRPWKPELIAQQAGEDRRAKEWPAGRAAPARARRYAPSSWHPRRLRWRRGTAPVPRCSSRARSAAMAGRFRCESTAVSP